MHKELSLYESLLIDVISSKYFLERSPEEKKKIIEYLSFSDKKFKKLCDRIEEKVYMIFDPSVFYKK